MSKPHYLSPRRRMRIMGRAPVSVAAGAHCAEELHAEDLDAIVRAALRSELAGFEAVPAELQELVRRELERHAESLAASAAEAAVPEAPPAPELGPGPEPPPLEAGSDAHAERADGDLRDQLARYERRIEKLVRSLGRAESALARMLRDGPPEYGLASIYRTVQGLDGSDRQYEQKREMLAQILQANLALQKTPRRAA